MTTVSQTIDKDERIASLVQFSKTPSRNHIAFLTQCDDDFCFVDVGLALSMKIEDILSDRRLSLKAQDYLNDILNANVSDSNEIGSYLAIKNIGILFEPQLQIDIEALFNKWSQNMFLIVEMGRGSIAQDKFFLGQQTDHYSVDLRELNYIVLK